VEHVHRIPLYVDVAVRSSIHDRLGAFNLGMFAHHAASRRVTIAVTPRDDPPPAR
jgi:hypothetical protein